MAVAFVQVKVAAGATASASRTVTLDAPPTPGNTLIAIVAAGTLVAGHTYTLASTGATWSPTAHVTATGPGGTAHQCSTTGIGVGAGAVVTATIDSGTARITLAVYEFSGLLTALSPFEVSSTASDQTGSGGVNVAAGTSAASTQDGALVVAGWMFANALTLTFTPGVGFTAPAAGQALLGATTQPLLSEYRLGAPHGPQTATGTTSDATGLWLGTLATYKTFLGLPGHALAWPAGR